MFIAIDLPAGYKEILKSVQTKLKNVKADVKWVEPDNCHITLKFLGNVLASQIITISSIIENYTKDLSSFPIELGALGAFPTIEKPQIIWVGVSHGRERLMNLANTLEEKLSKAGFSNETKPFNAHVTIGRARSNHDLKTLSSAIKTIDVPSAQIDIRHVTLFQSVLSSGEPKYSVLHRSSLK